MEEWNEKWKKILSRCRSSSQVREIRPIIRAPVHSDAIGALAPVRPGIVLSGGRDKVQSFSFSFLLIHFWNVFQKRFSL